MSAQYEVHKNDQKKRFEVPLGGDEFATLTFDESGDVIALIHTLVPEAYEGKGIAGMMARAALDYAKEHRLRVAVFCPFVKSFLQRHPEYMTDMVNLEG